jgi:hypothetical protein
VHLLALDRHPITFALHAPLANGVLTGKRVHPSVVAVVHFVLLLDPDPTCDALDDEGGGLRRRTGSDFL